MPKLNGIFDYFPELNSSSAEKIIEFLINSKSGDHKLIGNQLYNRVLYPQAIPVSANDKVFDLALLTQVLKLQPGKYYDHNFNKIYIPEKLLERFSNLGNLVWKFLDIFAQPGLTYIYLKSESLGTKNLGTLLKPQLLSKSGWIYIWLEGKKYQIKLGDSLVISANGKKFDLRFESTVAKLIGKENIVVEIAGGQFGIAVDARF